MCRRPEVRAAIEGPIADSVGSFSAGISCLFGANERLVSRLLDCGIHECVTSSAFRSGRIGKRLYILVLSHFRDANRCPLRWKRL
jgi:hypothetical protein